MSLASLVVHLKANSSHFTRNTDRVRSQLRSLTSVAARAAAAVGGVYAVRGAIQAAASVETMAVKFRVLTKSADTAHKLLGEITDLAASTPFQKMDLADAAQKLLAFGSSADVVTSELQRIGDISALIGAPIGEIAEIYGKARVQGRLFAEDINQLTGRGIPIIQQLAQQFGVADSEVKKLIEDGKIGFPQLEQAFVSMTAKGGMFENGMQQLSQTTEGKLSTLKDQFAAVSVQIGEVLLPHLTRFVDKLSQGLQPGGAIQRGLTLFIEQLASSIRLIERLAASSDPILETYLLLTGQTLSVKAQDTAGAAKRGVGFDLKEVRKAAEAQKAGPGGAFDVLGLFRDQQQRGLVESVAAAIGSAYQRLPEIAGNALGSAGQFVAEALGGDQSADRQEARFSGALRRDSAEAYSAVIRAMQERRADDPQRTLANNSQTQVSLLGDARQLLEQIHSSLEDDRDVVASFT